MCSITIIVGNGLKVHSSNPNETLFFLHTNSLGEGKNPSLCTPAMGK